MAIVVVKSVNLYYCLFYLSVYEHGVRRICPYPSSTRAPFAVKQHAMFNNKSIEQQNEQFTSSTSWFMVSD